MGASAPPERGAQRGGVVARRRLAGSGVAVERHGENLARRGKRGHHGGEPENGRYEEDGVSVGAQHAQHDARNRKQQSQPAECQAADDLLAPSLAQKRGGANHQRPGIRLLMVCSPQVWRSSEAERRMESIKPASSITSTGTTRYVAIPQPRPKNPMIRRPAHPARASTNRAMCPTVAATSDRRRMVWTLDAARRRPSPNVALCPAKSS